MAARGRRPNSEQRGYLKVQQTMHYPLHPTHRPQGISQGTDGGVILDRTVTVKYTQSTSHSPQQIPLTKKLTPPTPSGIPLRYRIAAPASQFTTTSSVPG